MRILVDLVDFDAKQKVPPLPFGYTPRVFPFAALNYVLQPRRLTQIFYPVVPPVAVTMINLILRPPAMIKRPTNPMGIMPMLDIANLENNLNRTASRNPARHLADPTVALPPTPLIGKMLARTPPPR